MNRVIGVTELQKRFRTVFDEVAHKHTAFILTRGSRPEAVLMPYDQYLKFAQAEEAGVLKRFDELLAQMATVNAQYTDEEVEADLKEASRVVRVRKRK
jgi:prevent-host-death family protein